MRSFQTLYLLAGLALALLPGCQDAGDQPTSTTHLASSTGFPLELRGTDGGVSILQAPATRVLPGNASAFDLVVAIAGPERIGAFVEGAQQWSVRCQRDGLELREDQLIQRLDMESVVTSDVDLIVTHAWQVTEQRPLLERAGVPALEIPEVLGRQELRVVFQQLGRALDEEEAAQALLDARLARLDKLAERDRSHWRLLNLAYGGNGGWSAGAGTTFDTMARWSGARNLLSERNGHLTIDLEALLELDPDAIVLGEGDDGAGGETLDFLRSDPRVQGLQAVQDGRLIVLPGVIYGTASHYLVEAAELVAAQLDEWDATGQ